MHDEEELETPEETKERQNQERLETLEANRRLKDEKIRETERRRREKKRFLEVDLSFHDMFRQSDTRVYYMKSNKFDLTKPNSPTWRHPEIADKLLSRFKYNKKKCDMFEEMLRAATKIGDAKQIEEYRNEADHYLTKCLHAHYGIGVLFREMLEHSVPQKDEKYD